MARKGSNPPKSKNVETITHGEATRKNIPTVEYQPLMKDEDKSPLRIAYERRNRDLDPQLVWRGKDLQDWSDLVVQAPPLYIQEKVHPKVLIDDLLRQSKERAQEGVPEQIDLFSDFNGLPNDAARTEFYQHDAHWSNRMILGDSLQVMASLAEREGLRGKVQCIYFDPPYGIKFNSNFQWSTTSRDVKDGNADHITREPEQVKAFRDTWRDGIHSYLTYLRDRLTLARDLLTDSGSIFVQISDENLHRVRSVMDEVFGDDSFVSLITVRKTGAVSSPEAKLNSLGTISDYIVWYAKKKETLKYRQLFARKTDTNTADQYRLVDDAGNYQSVSMESNGYSEAFHFRINLLGKRYSPAMTRHWSTTEKGIYRVASAGRVLATENKLRFKKYLEDFSVSPIANIWADLMGSSGLIYVVQTNEKIIERCVLMATDPGDLVLDPTCGSGTTAYVAEQWGRRWITIDTSRVALALARARIMGARYPFYLLADSPEGREKEFALRGVNSGQGLVDSEEGGNSGKCSVASGQKEVNSGQRQVDTEKEQSANHYPLNTKHFYNNIRHGFVYERVPHITLKSIANNTEIDVIWEKWQARLKPLREKLNKALKKDWQEWEIPRELPSDRSDESVRSLHAEWWTARIARQREIDASIAAKAEFEYLYDKPYQDKKTVRVAGPFTVDSLSPHRVLTVDENDELKDLSTVSEDASPYRSDGEFDFDRMVLDHLKTSGVQQAHRENKIIFSSLNGWPGKYICAEGRYVVDSGEGTVDSGKGVNSGEKKANKSESLATSHSSLSTDSSTEMRAGIFIGPEYGTVSRLDLVTAAREAGDVGFDVLIACAFNFDAHSTEFDKLGKVPILKARMNPDLHMADELKNTGAGNLFVVFGEPDITVASEEWLVDSAGRRIAPYEICKIVSGLDSLAKINALGANDLREYAALSQRREIWDYLADAAGGKLHSGEHRGGSSEKNNGGVSAIAWHCAGVPGGVGNFFDALRKIGVPGQDSFRELIGKLRGTKQNASWTHEIPATITTPLSTVHYSQVTIHGVDVFHPQTGDVVSDGPEGIACWFIDTDYNEESFFVRHAYFLGANDPYKSLKTTLKAEIDEEAWSSLHSATSRPFDKPKSNRIAVKVINHLGDEVMKVFGVG